MKKSKLLNLFLIISLLSVWSWPELSLAVEIDWFGSKSKDQIIYLKGYNAAMSKIAANLEIPKPTKTGTQPKTVSTLTTASSTTYVTNPMTANLDVNDFRIGNYNSVDAVYFDSAVNFGANPVYGRNLNFTTMENNQILLKGLALGSDSTAGHFSAFGSNSYALMAAATTSNSYAGYFQGKVDVVGDLRAANLLVGDFNQNIDTDTPILGVGVKNGVSGIATGWTEGAGVSGNGFWGVHGNASANNGVGIYGTVASGIDNAYAGYFKGKVEIENSILIVNNPYTYVTGTPPYFSRPDASVGIAVTGADWGIAAWGMNSTSGAGVSGKGYHGLEGQAIFEGGAGLYASNSGLENTLAGYFDGRVEMVNGGLGIDHGSVKIESASNSQPALSARVLVDGATAINAVATTPDSFAGHFYGNVVVDAGKVGIGTATPNKQLHIYSHDANAEIDIQSGANTHWGIYQDKSSGNLNFWHGENAVTFSDKGVSAKGFCLEKVCIDSWKDLKAILDQTDPVPTTGNRVPTQQ